jgi:DNA replication protein DnaC
MTASLEELMAIRAQKKAESSYVPDRDPSGFSNVLRAVAKKVPVETDGTEIGEDGFLHCKKCGGRRQREVNLPDGNKMTVSCGCRCMKEDWDAKEEKRKAEEETMRIDSLRTMAFPDSDSAMIQCTFDKDDGARPDVTAGMKNYCENFPYLRRLGKGILLYGTVGTGKSFFAACIVNDLVSKGYRCMMTTFPRLTNQISALWDGKQEFIDDLTRYDLIAIDDLGIERDTEYMNEHITMIVDALYRAKVPLVITSNYTPKQMKGEGEIRRQRIYDRLIEQCHPVEMSGESRRVIKGRKDYLEMKKLLGV